MNINSLGLFTEEKSTVINYSKDRLKSLFKEAYESVKDELKNSIGVIKDDNEIHKKAISSINFSISQGIGKNISILDSDSIIIHKLEELPNGNVLPHPHFLSVNGLRKENLQEDFENALVDHYRGACYYALLGKEHNE